MAALSPVHRSALAQSSQSVLARLPAVPSMTDMYLAGSAALALYLDHRPVVNLDWMSAGNRLLPADRRDLLQALVAGDPETRVETARDGYLHVLTGNGVALKFFYYPYPLVETEEALGDLWVASALDLALMKLGAIISRGTKRDFVDFYLLTRVLPLENILERSADKFGHVRDFSLQALKGLADDSLTAGEPMPRLNDELDWVSVRAKLTEEVRSASRVGLGIETVQRSE